MKTSQSKFKFTPLLTVIIFQKYYLVFNPNSVLDDNEF